MRRFDFKIEFHRAEVEVMPFGQSNKGARTKGVGQARSESNSHTRSSTSCVAATANQREAIFDDDTDQGCFIAILAQAA
jgi:hypothetical protein